MCVVIVRDQWVHVVWWLGLHPWLLCWHLVWQRCVLSWAVLGWHRWPSPVQAVGRPVAAHRLSSWPCCPAPLLPCRPPVQHVHVVIVALPAQLQVHCHCHALAGAELLHGATCTDQAHSTAGVTTVVSSHPCGGTQLMTVQGGLGSSLIRPPSAAASLLPSPRHTARHSCCHSRQQAGIPIPSTTTSSAHLVGSA